MGDVAKELAKMWNAVSDKSKHNKKPRQQATIFEERSAWREEWQLRTLKKLVKRTFKKVCQRTFKKFIKMIIFFYYFENKIIKKITI